MLIVRIFFSYNIFPFCGCKAKAKANEFDGRVLEVKALLIAAYKWYHRSSTMAIRDDSNERSEITNAVSD